MKREDWIQYLISVSIAMCFGFIAGACGVYFHWSTEHVLMLSSVTALLTVLILGWRV